ncbi:MAG: ADP-forming succinate--CoA ligase subunit beta [Chitinivibrionales bacterium]|nr:ADP-forming succinate--CoA ligase subunit beta [Chitinivibrionales bacterium]
MKLHEYQSRELLAEFGIPVPDGHVAQTPDEAELAARRLGGKAVIKAQVLTGGRGKAGGVKPAQSPEDAHRAADAILGMDIKGHTVNKVLVGRLLDITEEYYASVTIDRTNKRIVFIISAAGGVDIELVAAQTPGRIITIGASPLEGPFKDELLAHLIDLFPSENLAHEAAAVLLKMYQLFIEKDCSLVEVNPLVITRDGSMIAADAKILLDDNGLYKHPELERLRNMEEYSEDETLARKAGLSFVSLEGTVGCMVNGAGLAMATMDVIKHFGGSPANFLDVGGSSNPQKVIDALSIILRNTHLRAVLINIFGGITRCDDIAGGILAAREQLDISVPVIIRLIGTNQQEGQDLLQSAGMIAKSDMTDAVTSVVESVNKG